MYDILMKAMSYVAIIVLGYVLRRRGFFGPEAFGILSKIVIRITLPCALISSAAGKPIDLSYLTICLLGLGFGLTYMALGWLLNFRRGKGPAAFAMLNLPGYNIGTFALPFTQGFLGPMGVLTTSLFDVGNAFVCLGGAFGAARAVKEGGRPDWKRILKAPLSSIPFLTHLVLVTLNLLHLNVPGPVLSFASTVGGANSFLAMLMIGVGFRLSGDRNQLGAAARILAARFSVAAALACLCWFVLPFALEIRQALTILVFAPIGVAVPVFTADLGEDSGLSSAINSLSIVISIPIIVTLLMVIL